MYFALLCCPLLMTNVLHFPSGLIVSQTECHNVVNFSNRKFAVSFPFSFKVFLHSAISLSPLIGTTLPQLEKLPTGPIP